MKLMKYYLPLLSLLLAGCGGQTSNTPGAMSTNATTNAATNSKAAADTNEVAVIKTTEGDMVNRLLDRCRAQDNCEF